ncbi:MAG: hypothetical protein U0570_05120 [Phycisphaerales bacterium]
MKLWGVAALALGSTSALAADPCSQEVPGVPSQFSGSSAIARWDPDGAGPEPESLVASAFFPGSPSERRVMRWTGHEWTPLGDVFNVGPSALCVYQGQLYAAGSFTKVGPTNVLRVARWNGNSWEPVGAGFDNSVNALAVFRGELIAGGGFTKSGATPTPMLSAWNGTSWRALQTAPSGAAYALLSVGEDLIVGGNFSAVGGVQSRNVIAFNGTSWRAMGVGGPVQTVYSLATYRGLILAGGSVSLSREGGVLAWNGVNWSGVGIKFADVRALCVVDDLLYAGGGAFQLSDGTDAAYVVSWDSRSWKQVGMGEGALGTNPPPTPSVVGLVEFEGKPVAAGIFGSPSLAGVAQWNGSSWQSVSEALTGSVSFLQPFADRLFVGGAFLNVGQTRTNHVMSWTGGAWQPLGTGLRDRATAATVFGGKLVVGGGSPRELPESAGLVNTWDGEHWESLGGFNKFSPIRFGEFQSQLVAVGSGVVGTPNVYGWNGASWQPFGGAIAGIRCAATFGGRFIVGGAISSASGTGVDNLAGWDGSSWTHVGGGATGPVDSMVVWNDQLIIGGEFAIAGVTPAQNAAAWSGVGDNWTPMNAPDRVLQLIVYQGQLLARMSNHSFLARWTGTQWVDFPFDAKSIVGALDGEMATWTTSSNTTIGVGALPRYVSGAPTLPTQPVDPIAYCGTPAIISVVVDNVGSNTPTYRWRKNGAELADGPTGSGSTISGANGPELTIDNVGSADAGSYDVAIENTCGTILSHSAQLAPNCCPADLSGNGIVDDADFALFMPAYDVFNCDPWNQCPADFNRDGVIDDADFAIFASGYAEMVCP